MDQKEVLQATERAGFADLNGQIMRMCNILKPSQRTLNAVYSLCKNNPNFSYTEEQIVKSIGYLCDGGYLAIDHPKGVQCLDDLSGGGFGRIRLHLTAKGTQLLMGALSDPCIDD